MIDDFFCFVGIVFIVNLLIKRRIYNVYGKCEY